jgi:hypothetical protein
MDGNLTYLEDLANSNTGATGPQGATGPSFSINVPTNSILYSSDGNSVNGTSSLLLSGTNLSIFEGLTYGIASISNLKIQNQTISGLTGGNIYIEPNTGYNLTVGSDILPGKTGINLGSTSAFWEKVYTKGVITGPNTIEILPEEGGTVSITLENISDVLYVRSGGFAVDDVSAGFQTLNVDPLGFVTIRSTDSTSNTPLRILG